MLSILFNRDYGYNIRKEKFALRNFFSASPLGLEGS
jgi:hypothetical protein